MPVKIISFYGGPGTGKSTCASLLFSILKNRGLKTELVTEYVKKWVYEKRVRSIFDQYYFFAKQIRREYMLFKEIDYIVTDSPAALGSFYGHHYGDSSDKECFKSLLNVYLGRCVENDIEHVHVFLRRVKPFNNYGRYHSEEESILLDTSIKEYLTENNIKYIEIDGSEDGVSELLSKI
jgi:hypothetical protein